MIENVLNRFSLNSLLRVMGLAAFLFVATGCNEKEETNLLANEPTPLPLSLDVTGRQLHQQMNQVAYAVHGKALAETKALKQSIDKFLNKPDPFTQDEAYQQWQQAYSAFLATRFFGYLPISDPEEWKKDRIDYQSLLARVDSWPIEGGYIDYVEGYAHSGIVNDVTLAISSTTLGQQHQFAADESVSIGFHALEFLLKGEDGQRPASDYLIGNTREGAIESAREGQSSDSSPVTAGQNADRRRQYLEVAANMLADDIERMTERWKPVNGYYASLVDNSVADQVFMAGLTAGKALLESEPLSRLREPESETGGSEPMSTHANQVNSIAYLDGMKQWLLGAQEDAVQGALVIAFQNQHSELLERWQHAFAEIEPMKAEVVEVANSSEQLPSQSETAIATPEQKASEVETINADEARLNHLQALLEEIITLLMPKV
ncbi:MAG: imelysin family protein [Oceanobacter sp.]